MPTVDAVNRGRASTRNGTWVTGAVIAGGASRRMGVDKRGLLVEGVPMLRRTVLAVRAACNEVLVACRREAPPDPRILESLEARLVHDRLDDAGPLAGVEAALAAAPGELVLVVAGDMPWVDAAVLGLLVDVARQHPEADAVALATDRGPEPLLAVYRRRILPLVARMLDARERRMHALLDAVVLLEVPLSAWTALDPVGRTAWNVNRPVDLASWPDDVPVPGGRPQPSPSPRGRSRRGDHSG